MNHPNWTVEQKIMIPSSFTDNLRGWRVCHRITRLHSSSMQICVSRLDTRNGVLSAICIFIHELSFCEMCLISSRWTLSFHIQRKHLFHEFSETEFSKVLCLFCHRRRCRSEMLEKFVWLSTRSISQLGARGDWGRPNCLSDGIFTLKRNEARPGRRELLSVKMFSTQMRRARGKLREQRGFSLFSHHENSQSLFLASRRLVSLNHFHLVSIVIKFCCATEN